jgi:hypothetical protein
MGNCFPRKCKRLTHKTYNHNCSDCKKVFQYCQDCDKVKKVKCCGNIMLLDSSTTCQNDDHYKYDAQCRKCKYLVIYCSVCKDVLSFTCKCGKEHNLNRSVKIFECTNPKQRCKSFPICNCCKVCSEPNCLEYPRDNGYCDKHQKCWMCKKRDCNSTCCFKDEIDTKEFIFPKRYCEKHRCTELADNGKYCISHSSCKICNVRTQYGGVCDKCDECMICGKKPGSFGSVERKVREYMCHKCNHPHGNESCEVEIQIQRTYSTYTTSSINMGGNHIQGIPIANAWLSNTKTTCGCSASYTSALCNHRYRSMYC